MSKNTQKNKFWKTKEKHFVQKQIGSIHWFIVNFICKKKLFKNFSVIQMMIIFFKIINVIEYLKIFNKNFNFKILKFYMNVKKYK